MTSRFRLLSLLFFLALIFVLAAMTTGCGGNSSSTGGGGNGGGPTISFSASPTTITSGTSTTLTWTTTNATSVQLSPGVSAPNTPSGEVTVSPTATTTYTLMATGPGGTSTATVTVTVMPAAAPQITAFTANPTTVAAGGLTTLSWTTTGTNSVSISPSVSDPTENGPLPTSGSVAVAVNSTTTYTLTATGANNQTATATVTVTVSAVVPTITLTSNTTSVIPPDSALLSWTSQNATSIAITGSDGSNLGTFTNPDGNLVVSPTATTTYTATATSAAGSATSSVTITVPAAGTLAVTLAANPPTISPGQSSSLHWNSQNAVSVAVNGTPEPTSGSMSVSPSATTTYTAVATDSGGNTQQATATVTVLSNGGLQSNIKHIIFMLQENRSWDNYFGMLCQYRAAKGFTDPMDCFDPNTVLKDYDGVSVPLFHERTVRTENLSPSWDESHFFAHLTKSCTYKMDNWMMQATASVKSTIDPHEHRSMGFYDQTDLPFYYEAATQFATSDRWFSPVLANTIPNRMYLFTGTSFGHTKPDPPPAGGFTQKTIFDALTAAGVSWRYYYMDSSVFLAQFASWPQLSGNVRNISEYFNILASPDADKLLPEVIFIERGSSSGLDEHPDNNIQLGAAKVSQIVNALMQSQAWQSSVFILTFDEDGGLYEHVPPQPMPKPDDIAPIFTSQNTQVTNPCTGQPYGFDTTGFRVPLVVFSPWVRPNFVSHRVRDFTAILKLIETRYGVPALTARDAAQDDMTEFFDFSAPHLLTPPPLPAQPTNGTDDINLEATP